MKKGRLEKIIELISGQIIDTQEELQLLLKNNGYDVTQATVSRDIKELGLYKKLDGGRYRYSIPVKRREGMEKFSEIFRNSVLKVDSASNDVVIKCYSGMAGAACAALDSMDLPEVVGTLAGDDTIFIIARNQKAAEILVDILNNI